MAVAMLMVTQIRIIRLLLIIQNIVEIYRVFSIDYRIAPKYKYPTALNDVEKGYRWLLKQGYSPKDIIIAGDSAGGGLSLALTLKLKMNISQHLKC